MSRFVDRDRRGNLRKRPSQARAADILDLLDEIDTLERALSAARLRAKGNTKPPRRHIGPVKR